MFGRDAVIGEKASLPDTEGVLTKKAFEIKGYQRNLDVVTPRGFEPMLPG